LSKFQIAQNRGWLNQEGDYIIKNFAKFRPNADGFGFYQEFLHRLRTTWRFGRKEKKFILHYVKG